MRYISLILILAISFVNGSVEQVLTLDDAVNIALKNNKVLLTQKAKEDEAKAQTIVARANFMPTITVSGSYTRLSKVPEMGAVMMGELDNYVTGIGLEQPLFTWGKIWNAYQLAKLNLNAVEEDYNKTESEVIFNVTQAFYGVMLLTELVKLSEEAYQQVKRHVDVVKKRYDAGLAPKFDLIRARVQLSNMEPQVIKAKNGLKSAKNGLKVLLDIPLEESISLEGELKYEPVEINLKELIEEALLNRAELKSLKFRKKMSEKALALARASNKPNLIGIANYEYKNPFFFEPKWETGWNVTIALQIPFFSGFSTFGKVKEAKSQLKQVEFGMKLLRDGIELEVRDVVSSLEEGKKLVESQEKNVHQAEEALEIAERRYKDGLATSLEVMDTQLALTQAKTNYLQAISDYTIARARLKKTIGER